MANTYSQCYFHVVFSTKNRADFITPQIEQRVWAYMGGIARKQGFTALKIGGIEDHAHALLGLPPSILSSKAVQMLKGDSSFWMRRELGMPDFGWQDGYGIFTVCRSHIDKVIDYIAHQREHHKGQTFEEEYVRLLRLHDVEYDERYVFG